MTNIYDEALISNTPKLTFGLNVSLIAQVINQNIAVLLSLKKTKENGHLIMFFQNLPKPSKIKILIFLKNNKTRLEFLES
jgi:hypothetical protein